jgi:hypothetical protein
MVAIGQREQEGAEIRRMPANRFMLLERAPNDRSCAWVGEF